jgi:drug/metabolite transporter (DMT)-like permease
MELSWIGLVLVSALLHPLRDLMLKGTAQPMLCYVGVSFVWVVLAGCHAVATGQDLSLQKEVWPFVATSVLGLTIYYYGTLSALRRGNLSIYYPIIRSSPIAIVVFSWLAMGQTYSWLTIVGIFTVLLGGLMIQKKPGSFLEDQKAFVLAIIAMLGSALIRSATPVRCNLQRRQYTCFIRTSQSQLYFSVFRDRKADWMRCHLQRLCSN